jgi:ABC-type transport system involved in multi-copper enzyme maturation permease subunit
MEYKQKKSAVDLTDLAIGIIVLGIVVSIGVVILIGIRDSRLTDLSTFSLMDSVAPTGNNVRALTQSSESWFKGITSVVNESGTYPISSANYTVSLNQFGKATLTNTSANAKIADAWNITYDSYNTSRTDFSTANKAALGLGEYGNWFKIIVIVGVAAVILSLIFMAFGRNQGGSQGGIGGEY